jgi:two-component system heavy metal sensor histidine kinase CusS
MDLKALNESLPWKINTLRFRISIVYVAVIGLILILFQVVLYFNYANSVSKEFDADLQMKAEQIGGAINTFRGILGDQPQAFTLAVQQALNLSIEYPDYTFMSESAEKFWLADAKKLGLDKDYLVIMDSEGNVITTSKNVTKDLFLYFKKAGRANLNKNMFYKDDVNKSTVRIVIVPYYYTYNQAYIIAVGTSYDAVERTLRQHLLFIFVSTSIFLILASLVVRIFVIRVLSSVMEISKAARNISQENLHARIKLTHADQEIEHLTVSLNEMIARLEKSFSHIKEFSLEMAHEVKTPLAIISGESQLALERDHTTEEYREMFRVVSKEAKRTQRFVSDLLLLTKLDYRLIKLRFEPIDLAEFLKEICGKMRGIAVSQGIVIQENIPKEAIAIKGDRIHLRRVFFNLIDNALKFTPHAGSIDVVLERHDQKAIILVTDTGCGINQDEIPKIFNKFYRVNEKNRDVESGCGLGLNIVSSIVTLHGGSISVQSELGKGTAFRMEFPLI